MPSSPQPWRREICSTNHWLSEPTELTLTRLPLRSATVLIALVFGTAMKKFDGGPHIAAMPFSGAPLAMKAKSVPALIAMSMLFAIIA